MIKIPRYRISFAKEGPAKFISHLDMLRTFERAVRRAELPVSLSQGFNPHPRLIFGFPLPVGTAGMNEYLDMELKASMTTEKIVNSLNKAMPPGIRVNASRCLKDDQSPSLMAQTERSLYEIRFDGDQLPSMETMQKCLEEIMKSTEVIVMRNKKDGGQSAIDIRPGLINLSLREENCGILMEAELMTGSALNVRAGEVVSAIRDWCGIDIGSGDVKITRTRTMGTGGKDLFG